MKKLKSTTRKNVQTLTYGEFGASATKGSLHQALRKAGVPPAAGYFANISPDIAGDSRYVSFLHCDGAGTKSIVAYLMYRETGDVNHFAGLAQDALVMNLDDVFCLGQPEQILLANTIARNPFLIGDEIIEVLLKSYRELTQLLSSLGVHITLAGGETADCGDIVRTLLVDAVITGRILRNRLIDTGNIKPGDVIIGLSSTGQATYETRQNSGIGSNGLTLARHALLSHEYVKKYPEILAPELQTPVTYQGPFLFHAEPSELGMSLGEALLSPTRTYAPLLSALSSELGSQIHGVIHNTGGGQTKVLRFGKGKRYVKNALFDVPPLFLLVQQHGGVPWKEMYQVFNMGHRLEIYSEEKFVSQVRALAHSFQIEAKVIGHVEKLAGSESDLAQNRLHLETPYGSFDYDLARTY